VRLQEQHRKSYRLVLPRDRERPHVPEHVPCQDGGIDKYYVGGECSHIDIAVPIFDDLSLAKCLLSTLLRIPR
jgi:hypothetical protein